MTTAPIQTGEAANPGRAAWLALGLACGWVVLLRVPIMLNAVDHLDSDLAVDGLTLLDATRGRWRWHYPGTPFTGTGAVLLSLPQAVAWGVTPRTLVSGGTVAFLGLVAAVFWLAWRVGGPSAAGWSLVPLTFASTGMIWLSARITGGHLVAAAWHAGAFALLHGVLTREGPGRARAFGLGLWCGFGVYLDSMVSVTLAGMLAATAPGWFRRGEARRSGLTALAVAAGFLAGFWPRPVGAWLDPHDAYRDQFAVSADRELVAGHSRLLALDCLPRLIAGHRLPGLETDPGPASKNDTPEGPGRGVAAAVVALTFAAAGASAVAVVVKAFWGHLRADRVVCGGLMLSAAATLVGFVANRNIFNSDNYRYLVGLLVPLSLGAGLGGEWLWRRGSGGRVMAVTAAVALAALMTADAARWYARFGWLDAAGRPVRKPADDQTLAWLDANPEVSWVEGGYWDVYRLAFLTGGRVRGAPFPVYPNRFPEWRPAAGSARAVIVRATPEGAAFGREAARDGLRPVHRARGVTILRTP